MAALRRDSGMVALRRDTAACADVPRTMCRVNYEDREDLERPAELLSGHVISPVIARRPSRRRGRCSTG
jgi:hypothetical protein